MAESSFDVVSSVDAQEVRNAIGQAMKEITTRFDLKGSGSNIELKALSWGAVEKALGGTARQAAALQKGIPSEKAREIVKIIKGTKLKVQGAIQGDQVRVSGKNKDDLQAVIRLLKETDLGIDMQFTNYR